MPPEHAPLVHDGVRTFPIHKERRLGRKIPPDQAEEINAALEMPQIIPEKRPEDLLDIFQARQPPIHLSHPFSLLFFRRAYAFPPGIFLMGLLNTGRPDLRKPDLLVLVAVPVHLAADILVYGQDLRHGTGAQGIGERMDVDDVEIILSPVAIHVLDRVITAVRHAAEDDLAGRIDGLGRLVNFFEEFRITLHIVLGNPVGPGIRFIPDLQVFDLVFVAGDDFPDIVNEGCVVIGRIIPRLAGPTDGIPQDPQDPDLAFRQKIDDVIVFLEMELTGPRFDVLPQKIETHHPYPGVLHEIDDLFQAVTVVFISVPIVIPAQERQDGKRIIAVFTPVPRRRIVGIVHPVPIAVRARSPRQGIILVERQDRPLLFLVRDQVRIASIPFGDFGMRCGAIGRSRAGEKNDKKKAR